MKIDAIQNNSYILNYENYIEQKKVNYKDDIAVGLLGDVCEFLPKSKHKASHGKNIGKYPFFKSSNIINSFVDIPDYNENSIIIGTGGNPNIKFGTIFSCSSDNFILKMTNNVTKYLYYYLLHNMYLLEKGFKGSTIKHISKIQEIYTTHIIITQSKHHKQKQ